jgi:hypothetical protein
VKLLVNYLHATADENSQRSIVSSIFSQLFEIIEKDGDLTGDLAKFEEQVVSNASKGTKKQKLDNETKEPESQPEESEAQDETLSEEEILSSSRKFFANQREALVVAASIGVVRLCTKPVYRNFVMVHPDNPDRFIALALVAQNDNHSVREKFLTSVYDHFRDLPNHWIVLLTFAANDQDPLVTNMKAKLDQLITRQRKIIAMQKQSLALALKSKDKEQKEEEKPSSRVPELALVDLIHLLASHPDFELKNKILKGKKHTASEEELEEDFHVFNYFSKFLDFFFDVLLPRNVEHDYSLLLQICASIRRHEDGSHPSGSEACTRITYNSYCLAELSHILLEARYKGKEWLGHTHPGRITLPPSMFRPLEKKSDVDLIAATK